jgi:hypothetical protein
MVYGGVLLASQAAPAPAESVVRPDAGLARGRYEAPSWVFVTIAVVAIVGLIAAAAFALFRRGRGGAKG